MVTFTNMFKREIESYEIDVQNNENFDSNFNNDSAEEVNDDKENANCNPDSDGDIDCVKENENGLENANQNPDVPVIPKRSSTRIRNQPEYLRDYVNTLRGESYGVDYCYKVAPKTYKEAVKSNESFKWKEAMDEEMGSFDENETFELVELPPGKHTVDGRWVYAIKPGPNDEDIYKARYVAKGFGQTYGVDYFTTFAPTTRLSTIRMVIQVAVQCDYIIHQMDVKSAYLNAPIDCEVYMEQPEGYEVQSKDGKKYVCKLLKSLVSNRVLVIGEKSLSNFSLNMAAHNQKMTNVFS